MTTTDLEQITTHGAPNYHPLPVVIAEAEGAWATDVDGRRYFDALSGYSALNFGHRHPALVAAARAQLDRLTLISRAFDHDQFEPFCRELAELCGMDMVLPMNTGAEGVETAIKVARRWGYQVKGVAPERATIITFAENFHGRTTTIVGFSTDASAREGFGPFAPGFVTVPFADAQALADAIDDTTVAVLLEPVQGEAGVVVPPPGYVTEVRRLCDEAGVLLIADEIQSGLGRTGRTFAVDHDGVTPDMFILGKALSGGILPVSAVVSRRDVLGVLTPGSHGSTFGGNPLACAVARAVIALLRTGEYQDNAARMGRRLADGLATLPRSHVSAVRSIGLWAGIDLAGGVTGRAFCERLLELGVLAKDTHGSTIRLGPPLSVTADDVDFLVDKLAVALETTA
ncbi:MAG TPA: ornithine--oxo-acid transaminase [Euzebyales bacterium]|nr:ornithine--oxo-acid transaminase [Euzebyales bacterium]